MVSTVELDSSNLNVVQHFGYNNREKPEGHDLVCKKIIKAISKNRK